MEYESLLMAVGTLGAMGLLLALGLAMADRLLAVDEDPRTEALIEALPGANCGGCGVPGCAAFAQALLSGAAGVGGCPVNSQEGVEELAEIMGVEPETLGRNIARIMCHGGDAETAKKGEYLGVKTCLAGQLNKGGDKLCEYGCMGFGDCVAACPFDAMYMNDNGLPVVIEDKCTGCSNCVVACPRDIVELVPEERNLFVFCRSQDEAKYARTVCTVSCVGCGSCVKGVDDGMMFMDGQLAKINYTDFGTLDSLPTEKCPNDSLKIQGLHPVPTVHGDPHSSNKG